ncbi:hypothetical protein H2199_008615 [Coniosporium tulheliwenetii]|uniref:Uncharacterized protein n=1 Tax=Coniosporium tulheliwenetii TaxID=3383036 RepID=A0ACC2YIV7_9PEZI|nr:hypothetical protein H2199_008615 [Cladosporium sp. JES 115]
MARGRAQATKVRPKPASSTVTAVKTKPSHTVTEEPAQALKTTSAQLIEQKQSTEVVQTLLHGSISCLSYLRNLFPEKCFDDLVYETSSTHLPYEDYTMCRSLSPPNKDKERTRTTMKVLQKGRSEVVDKFLAWLVSESSPLAKLQLTTNQEDGAFDALKRNVLRAIQLNIFEQADKPNDVVETYTFTFNYIKSADKSTTLASLEMQGPRGQSVTVFSASHALQMFIRRVIALCGTLPDLPERRYLTMHLFYTDDCDPEYEPPGFEASQNTQIRFPENGAWQKTTQSCGTMDAGFHTVSLKVSHLHYAQDAVNSESAPPSEIPSGLPYTAAAFREDDIEMVRRAETTNGRPLVPQSDTVGGQSMDVQASKGISAPDITIPAQQLSQTQSHSGERGTDGHPMITGDLEESRDRDAGNPMDLDAFPGESREITAIRHDGPIGEVPYSQQETQLLDAPAETALASGSQQTTQVLDEDWQAKDFFQKILEPSIPSQTESLEETQPVEYSGNAQQPFRGIAEQMSMFHLSQRKIDELDSRKLQLSTAARGKTRSTRSTTNLTNGQQGDVVDCQCGWNEEEDDMCLLQEKEAPLLRELQDLALLRRGVHIIQIDGYFNDRKFSEALHCDLQTASRVLRHLQKAGYIIPNPGYTKKSYKSTGKPTHHLVSTGPDFSRMMKEYFDPRTKIAHHGQFELPHDEFPMTAQTTQFPAPPADSEPAQTPLEAMEIEQHAQLNTDETQDDGPDFQSSPSAAAALRCKSARQQPLRAANQKTSEAVPLKVSGWTSARQLPSRRPSGGKALQERNVNVPSPVSTPKKRVRNDKEMEDEEPFAPVSARTRKRLKGSMTQGIVNIGYVASPSPMPL